MNGRKNSRGVLVGSLVVATLLLAGALSLAWAVRADALEVGPVETNKRAHTQAISDALPFEPRGRLKVSNGNGAIHISTWERPEVSIEAVKRVQANTGVLRSLFGGRNQPGLSLEEARNYLDKIQIEITRKEGTVCVSTQHPRHHRKVNLSVSYQIRVPREATLNIETSNGAVRVSGVSGSVVLKTSNGRIECDAVGGPVRASSSNGAIFLQRTAGSVKATTSNGRIEIDANQIPTAKNDIECRTSNGAISVRLPGTSGFILDASTSNGRIQTDFPVTLSGQIDRHRVYGTVGKGGPKLCLRTSNGSVNVRKGPVPSNGEK